MWRVLLPRKARYQWIVFLLLVCILGLYLTFKRVGGANRYGRDFKHYPTADFIQIQDSLKKQVKKDLKLGKIEIDPTANSKVGKLESGKNVADGILDLESSMVDGVPAGRILVNDEDYISNEEKLARLKLLVLQLSPTDWKSVPDPDEIILLTKSEFSDLDIQSGLTCREIDRLVSNNRQLGYHGKKFIDHMKPDRNSLLEMVVKSVGNDDQFKIDCMKQDYNPERCHALSNYKLVKELVLLNVLEHPSIIKVLGFCLRGDTIDLQVNKKGVVIVTESGMMLDHGVIYNLPWISKLQVSLCG